MSASNELLHNLDKLHTTELGVVRIKRNLPLDTDDVVGWCRDKINSDKAVMLAVKGMLPHNTLGREMLTKLRVFKGAEHNHEAQKPEMWNF